MFDPSELPNGGQESPGNSGAQPKEHEGPPLPPPLAFPVVAIGASAGGLEALVEFFGAMPPDSGLAFVVIQHLPPEHESKIAEILSRYTAMPVQQISDGLPVEVNHVYIIRPGFTVTLRHGELHLGAPLEQRGHERPVDDFFRSVAEDQGERAIAVVLSGMGSNGAAGAQAVKAAGGVCVAQDPSSAKFPSMPTSLIEAGHADFVLPPREIAAFLVRYRTLPYATGGFAAAPLSLPDKAALNEILSILRLNVRRDFTGYKRPTLLRRITRRMSLCQLTELADYVRHLRQDPGEALLLAEEMTVHVTGFFRDPPAWDALVHQVIEPLVAGREHKASLRAWVTACASGEEAYTLAIVVIEAMEAAGKRFDLKIFATDPAERSLAHARAGVYPGGIESDLSPERLARFFERDDVRYRVKKELRDCVVFAPQNLLQDPPFSRLDLCTCRNLLIYLEPELQRRALALIHFGLRDHGVLFLGSSETITGLENLFVPIDARHRLFRRIGDRQPGLDFPAPRSRITPATEQEPVQPREASPSLIAQLTHRLLLERYSPAAVVVDRQLHIRYFHGATERYIDPPRGEPTRELFALARDTIRSALRVAVQRALADNTSASTHEGYVETPAGRSRVEIAVHPLEPRAPSAYFLISFHESRPAVVTAPPPEAGVGPDSSPADLHDELQLVRDELRGTLQELQTSNEELRAANEEATSINEEMQSANEELETSKEELQSLNEELVTVNSQLQVKMAELQATTSDLGSLLTSTDIGVVFLDPKLRIRRFTRQVCDLFELLPSDLGRPLSDLSRKFDDPNLLVDAAVVLEKLVPLEKEVVSTGGRFFLRRILPYRTTDDRIEGVVLTFIDITARLRAEAALHERDEIHRLILDGITDHAVLMLDPTGLIAVWNPGAQRALGYSAAEIVGQPFSVLFTPEDCAAGLPAGELVKATAQTAVVQEGWRVRKDGRRFWSSGALSPLLAADSRLRGFVLVLRDETGRVFAEASLKSAQRAEAANEAKDEFLTNVSHELRTPLAAILLWSTLIEQKTVTDPAKLATAISAIRHSAEEQQKLIEDLVDTARISSGRLRLELRQVNLAGVVHAGLESIRPFAGERKVHLVENFAATTDLVEIDVHRIEQVVRNLVHNAVKFTPPDGEVTVKLQRKDNHIEIVVADNGNGIAPDFLPRVFERFSRAESAEQHEPSGLGIGLSIVRQLVNLHGGSMTAESPGLGLGSTFTVRLPLPAFTVDSGCSESGGLEVRVAGRLTGRHILLVEDVASVRRALSAVLQEAGAEVIAVDSAPAAWDAIQHERPDVIISDIGLPLIDGYTFMRQLRATEKASLATPIPAVALTAFAGTGVRSKALESGFQSCLTKPITPGRLIGVLATLLQ